MTFDPAIVEAVRVAICGTSREYASVDFNGRAATSALTALCTAHPGIAAVLAGEAVVVPRELDDNLRRVVWRAQYEYARAHGGPEHQVGDEAITDLVERRIHDPRQRGQDIHAQAAMLAASPYAPTPGREDGK